MLVYREMCHSHFPFRHYPRRVHSQNYAPLMTVVEAHRRYLERSRLFSLNVLASVLPALLELAAVAHQVSEQRRDKYQNTAQCGRRYVRHPNVRWQHTMHPKVLQGRSAVRLYSSFAICKPLTALELTTKRRDTSNITELSWRAAHYFF